MKEGNVGLILESYQDLFSDFDPRPISDRSLSVDFLDEAKRATRDKAEGFELNLLVPKKLKSSEKEIIIKKRLKGFFSRHHEEEHKKYRKLVREGVLFIVFGVILMFLASLILFYGSESNFFISFMTILLEPAGWFLFWEGLDLLIFETKKRNSEKIFLDKMVQADINFKSY